MREQHGRFGWKLHVSEFSRDFPLWKVVRLPFGCSGTQLWWLMSACGTENLFCAQRTYERMIARVLTQTTVASLFSFCARNVATLLVPEEPESWRKKRACVSFVSALHGRNSNTCRLPTKQRAIGRSILHFLSIQQNLIAFHPSIGPSIGEEDVEQWTHCSLLTKLYSWRQMRRIQSGIDLSLILAECAYCKQVLPHTHASST